MGNHPVTEADPKVMEEAKETWHHFMVVTKWSIISVALVLAFMALFLV